MIRGIRLAYDKTLDEKVSQATQVTTIQSRIEEKPGKRRCGRLNEATTQKTQKKVKQVRGTAKTAGPRSGNFRKGELTL